MSFKSTLIGALALSAFSTTAGAALTNNNIYVGFRAIGANGTQQDVIVNIGDFASLNTVGNIININSSLSTAFGDNWNTRSDVVFGAIGRDGTSGSFDVYAGSFGGGYSTSLAYSLSTINSFANSGGGAIGNLAGSAGLGATMIQWDASNSWSALESGFGNNASPFNDPRQALQYSLFESGMDFSVVGSPKSFTLWNAHSGTTDYGQVNAGFTYSLDSLGNISVAAVPEPSTYGLMGAGALAALAAVRRRRNKIA